MTDNARAGFIRKRLTHLRCEGCQQWVRNLYGFRGGWRCNRCIARSAPEPLPRDERPARPALCMWESPQGWLCTRPANHEGDHE